ncbi:hypothetical protein H4219_002977 [Mycoemilia scoparia]|uniref:Peptidase S1 domain-containing protein n=1 Tax=Mycoemilia scoparia TaxID=417184 RepID=A0A9W7ZW60_9FUNG|nr:hypothetical protein H4219_002977 [Mycoemilia scoparia]
MVVLRKSLLQVLTIALVVGLALSLPSSKRSGARSGGPYPRIIGGKAASNDEFRSIVHLFVNDLPTCGGALISLGWAVTAAHCVTNTDKSTNTFKVAKKDKLNLAYGGISGADNKKVGIKNIHVHPDFDGTSLVNDIAILELDMTLSQTRDTSPIKISSAMISSGQTLTVGGWGQTNIRNRTQSGALNFAEMVAAPVDQCKEQVTTFESHNGPNICTSFAASKGAGTCNGDSGGPLMIKNNNDYELVGLVSFDVNSKNPDSQICAVDGIYSFFTNVRVFVDFISQVTKINSSDFVDGSVNKFNQIGISGTISSNNLGNNSNGSENDINNPELNLDNTSGKSGKKSSPTTMNDQEMETMISKVDPGHVASSSGKATSESTSKTAKESSDRNGSSSADYSEGNDESSGVSSLVHSRLTDHLGYKSFAYTLLLSFAMVFMFF